MTAYWNVLRACAAHLPRVDLPSRIDQDMSLRLEFQARRDSLHSPCRSRQEAGSKRSVAVKYPPRPMNPRFLFQKDPSTPARFRCQAHRGLR